MESDVNSKKKKKIQNGSTNYDKQAETQSMELDKAKKKILNQSNPLVNNINGLTRTNGITGLSVHTSDVRNGEHSESCYNVQQGEINSDSVENTRDTVGPVINGETENSGTEDVREMRASPTENGYKNGSSNSEDEVCDGESAKKGQILRCNSNASCSNNETENVSEERNGQSTAMQNNSPKMQAARPKTISWSRTVKHRRDRKNNFNKCKNKSQNSSSKIGYIYPELCSSSDDDFEDVNFLISGSRNSSERNESCHTGANKNDRRHRNGLGQRQIENDTESSPNVLIGLTSNAVDTSCQSFESDGNSPMPTFNNVDIMNSSMLSAPLALPEDSDGYSTNSSDSNTQLSSTCPNLTTTTTAKASTTTTKMTTTTTTSRTLITQTSQFIYTERTTIDSICFEEHKNIEQAMRPKPLRPNSSADSLEEIGDYIETDFPNKDSRLLFQCSSRSSSSTDEDEGYGVNEVPRNMDLEPEGQSYPPPSESTNFTLSCSHNVDTNQLGSDVSGNNSNFCGCNNVNVTFPPQQSKRLSRLGSSTGRSESGSELGGMLGGSDSSAVYSPETDFMEFLDMDQPFCIGDGQKSLSLDLADPCLSTHTDDMNDNNSNSVNLDYLEDNGNCVLNFGTNDLRGAEGGLTNDLNFDCKSDDFDPDAYNNMESYDPHLADFGNENFHYHDSCKHEKVPRANFKNSESNRKEKIFFKCAMDGNQSSSSGSSDDEENLLHCLPREVIFNHDRPPQNGDDADCMVLEDLEHLTHALQNAVIMQLPSKLEESSGESSEEPIYEDIDNLEHSSEILPVLPEESPKSSENVITVLPKYERRKRRGHHRSHSDVEKVMIWNEYEAYVLQVKQIGTSACGATAILNVLKALDFKVDKEEVCKTVQTNLRMEAAPVPYYLFSRSSAGTTADYLIEGIERLTDFSIKGRFFHFYPPRKVELLKWLGYWIKKGAVPIATLNLQCGVKPGWTIPDAWHHQMVYGVSSKGVYLTNPLEIVQEEVIMEQLTSDSVLLVRRQDVVNRFRDWAPLNDILKQRDKRWQTMNVLGQVVNVLREACTALSHQVPRYRAQLTSHISIPAAYKAGVTLFVRGDTELCTELFTTPELELKDGSKVTLEDTTSLLNDFANLC